jgi:hypothetical protein
VAIASNFVVVDRLVMPATNQRSVRRFARFWLLNNSLVPLGLGLFYGLVHGVRMHYLTANLLSIIAVFSIRYVATSRWIYGAIDSVPPAAIRRLGARIWHAAQTRIALAFLLTLVAVPGMAALSWNGLWSSGPDVPLLIPLAAAGALAIGRLRPRASEPDVHDRQVDALIAGMLLVAAVVLTAVAPDRPSSSFLLAVSVAFLAAATTLLLGTRTATRLRWALLLPMVAAGLATPTPLDRAGIRLVDSGAALLSLPFGGRLGSASLTVRHANEVLVVTAGPVAGTALVGTLMCLFVAGLCCFGPRPALLLRVAPAAATATVVAILSVVVAMLAGHLLGPEAFRVAQLPAVADLALATTVVIVVWRWSRRVRSSEPVKGHYLPRTRLAVVALVVVAVALGVQALPHLAVVVPRPTVASNVAPIPPSH